MTTRLVLVRHATCASTEHVLLGRAIDAPLDARGEAQARAVAGRLAQESPDVLQASPRRRTRQTAQAIAERTGGTVADAAALDEVDFGAWCGQSFEQLEADDRWRDWNARRGSARTPAGEDMAGVLARVLPHVQALADAFAGGLLVLVTHAEVIRAVVLHHLGMPADEFHRIAIAPASLTTLRFGGTAWEVERVNEQVAA